MDNRSSEDEHQSELVAPSTPSDYLEQDSTSSATESLPDNQEDVAGPSTIPTRCPQPSPGPDPTPRYGGRKRKGKKTQVMEAVEKGLDRIFHHEAASGGDYMRYERDRLEWEKETERNRMDFERCRFDFEMRRMEAEERRSRENRELIMQLFQCLRPTAFPSTTPFNYSPYPSYFAPSEVQFGPPAPSDTPVSHPKQQSHPHSLP
ncbi:hypothetical protein Q7C36_019964 [Tachysurus vachellii]|uniref:Uncharacterized protein n=1 Tax=Tachysurus vachellii TaxID=175792 RepID=A0AA88LSS4_TACVA|nr:hypothetical protein Q7C36_019964 [Tachysurus vachellii]